MSSPSEAPESSRDREEQPQSSREREQPEVSDEDLQPRPRPWVALSSIPVVLGADDKRAEMVAPGVADLVLHLEPPLRASYLVLPERIAPVPDARTTTGSTCILATCSTSLLFMATRAGNPTTTTTSFDFFLGDAHARTVTLLPIVPFHIRCNQHLQLIPRRSIGLIADPRHPGHHMVFQLHPIPTKRHNSLLCYSTATGGWTSKALAPTTYPYPYESYHGRKPWNANGVLAHDGLLWWIDIAGGMLVCDPFADHPDLRFVPLPAHCQAPTPTTGHHAAHAAVLMDHRRFIRLSQGKLRYVQIMGFSYDMFTLVNLEGPDRWRFEYTMSFANISGYPCSSCDAAAGLTMGVKPSLALVDPNDANIVFFFVETLLFAVDRRVRRVIGCQEFLVDSTHRNLTYQYSSFIDAWEFPPTLLGDNPSSDGIDGSAREGPGDDEAIMDVATASDDDDEELANVLSQMEIKSQPDGTHAFPELQSMPEDMAPPPSGSPRVAGDQAGDQADDEDEPYINLLFL